MDVNNNSTTKQDRIITLWVNNQKYQVPESFLQSHPGGYNSIYQKNNQDCTIDYNFHSKNAQKIWKQFLISNNSDHNNFECNIL